MSKTKPRTVNYRRCEWKSAEGKPVVGTDLQTLIEQAKAKVPEPWKRPIGMGGDQDQYLTHLVKKQSCICGALIVCDKNRKIALVDTQDDGSFWEAKIEAKSDDGKKRSVENQTLFFAVRENHVAIIQTKALNITDLQDFLVWFIQSKAGLAPDSSFALINVPSKEALAKLQNQQIKSISVGREAFWVEKTPDPNSKPDAKRQRFIRTLKSDPLLVGLLKKITGNNELVEQLDATDPGSIWIGVEISYRSRSEKDAQHIMRSVAASFAGIPELAPEIGLGNKTKIKGDELTIGGSVDVQHPDGIISKDDAMTRVAEWLLGAISSRKVLV